MLIACWSPKGGSGTTVVSVALALTLAADGPALLADLRGDVPAVLGLPEPSGLGLGDWLAAEADVPDDALEHLELDAAPQLRILPAGTSQPLPARAERDSALATALAADARPVVADCGPAAEGAGLAVAAGASVSLIVLRPCYLALRRALAAPIRASGVVVVPRKTVPWDSATSRRCSRHRFRPSCRSNPPWPGPSTPGCWRAGCRDR